jgi:hypothetical protein
VHLREDKFAGYKALELKQSLLTIVISWTDDERELEEWLHGTSKKPKRLLRCSRFAIILLIISFGS